jgi:hypothetical protein
MTATATRVPSSSVIQRKIAALTELAARAATPQEKDAAEGRLARFRELLEAALDTAQQRAGFSWEPRWAGSKYVRGEFLSTVQIAALIRAEVKVARALGKVKAQPGEVAVPDPVADAPAQIRIGIRVPRYGSIHVTVKNIPRDWGYDPEGSEDVYRQPCEGPSRALYELGEALDDLAGAWNYDNSDAMTDYFDTRYYLRVTDEDGRSIDRMPSRMKYGY